MTVRLAILQTDSSHCEAYAALTNGHDAPLSDKARVVAMWGEDSAQTARKAAAFGLDPSLTIAAAAGEADVIMICGRWGETHYDVACEALRAGKPLYIDKPMTNSPTQADNLASKIAEAGVPAFSCSPFRFASQITDFIDTLRGHGAFRGADIVGLSEKPKLGDGARSVFFYGVHLMEIVHTVFGPGISSVLSTGEGVLETVLVRYADGRQIVLHPLKDAQERWEVTYHGAAGTARTTIPTDGAYYRKTLQMVITMAETNKSPIPLDYGVEIVRALRALEMAREHDGWVALADVRDGGTRQ